MCNGVELSSGAVRNHDPEIMVKAFELVGLGEEDVKAKFPAMYNAFCYGAPPHAGIAPGVDRMVMLIAGEFSRFLPNLIHGEVYDPAKFITFFIHMAFYRISQNLAEHAGRFLGGLLLSCRQSSCIRRLWRYQKSDR